ncbi:serum response factor-binding protein 1-like [Mizuhopecten yessoensis]|uniref:Serum response factor-binding protein 1 n=1 Tax=Mizuhopecten yessoensis TaxID=6573 RepID=A0A210QDQ8_MIZYE|nr:serum response factor-binding protein 1-like [Mizuhopecten yessoensis]OWF46894.1 Serum response factor-binding protein 1 [Mizuhopecten yessoensis]
MMEEHEDDAGKEEEKRSLDNALKASIDLVALNNKVVCMRGTVKKAKIYTIRKLKNRLRLLKERKGNSEELAKDQRRLKRFREEIHVIRHLKKDIISKYALGCTDTVHGLCNNENDVAIEIRALTRLAEHKLMQMSIKKFRDEHEDWKSLAAFLLTKQSGRRFKKNQGPTPIEKMITNVKTGQLMVKTYLQDKLERNVDIPKDKNIRKKKNSVEEDTMSGSESDNSNSNIVDAASVVTDHNIKSSKTPRKSPLKSKSTEAKFKESSLNVKMKKAASKKIEVVNFNSKELDDSECVPNLMDDSQKQRDLVAQLRGISDEESNSESEMEDSEEDTSEQEGEGSDEPGSSGVISPRKQNMGKVCGEMVVKKLDLDDDVVDESFMTGQKVEIFSDEKSLTKKSKRKKASDSFFVRSESSDEDEGTESEEDEENDDEESNNFSNELDEPLGNPASKGKTALRSTFMFALSDSKNKSKSYGGRGKKWEGPDRGGRSGGRDESGGYKGGGKVLHGNYRGGMRGSYDDRNTGHGNFDRSQGRGGFDGYKERGNFDGNRGRGSFDGNRGRGSFDGNRGYGKFAGGRGQNFDRQGGHDWKSDQKGFSSKYDASQSVPDKSADVGQIHPSWQASKKRKEQSGIQSFQGKKIKFDD